MKKIQVSVLLMLSLHIISVDAAQASPHDVEQGRQVMIDDAVKNFPYLTQGFDFLRTQNLVGISFHDFLEQNVSHDEREDEEMNFDHVIIKAEDILTKNMKNTFLQTLDTTLKEYKNLNQFDDPVFLYVMQHKDNNMRDIVRLWVYEWNNIKNKWNGSALYGAVFNNNTEIVRMLLAVGADINIQDEDGETPLYRAAFNNNTEIAGMLLTAGADVNNYNWGSPLHSASFNKNTEIVRMLLAAGAYVNIKDENGKTPLHYAAWNYSVEIVKMLIAAGANVNNQGKHGGTPLHCAAWNDNAEIVEMLIAAGANVNNQDKYGGTPLHGAVLNDNAEIVEMLIAAGADLNIKNKLGETAEKKANTSEMRGFFAQDREKQQEKADAQAMARFEKMIRKDWR